MFLNMFNVSIFQFSLLVARSLTELIRGKNLWIFPLKISTGEQTSLPGHHGENKCLGNKE